MVSVWSDFWICEANQGKREIETGAPDTGAILGGPVTMSNLKVYQYAKCGTCRKAVKWLEAQGHELELIPIFDTPPSETELTELIQKSGLEVKKFFNTSGEVYKEQQLKDKLPGLSTEEQIRLLASNGRLIKRPIVTDGHKVTVGFKEDTYEQEWNNT